MTRKASRVLPVVVGVLTVVTAACSGSSKPETGELDIEPTLTLCAAGNNGCVSAPAAGAVVRIYQDGTLWRTVRAGDTGLVKLQVPPGRYVAKAALPTLGWTTHRSAEVDVAAGGGADVSIGFPARRLGPPLSP